jgi:cytochrome P450 PksS
MSYATDIDLTSAEFRTDPYPLYARLRAEAPVCRVRAGLFGRAWLITRYHDVAAALKDERFTKDFRKVRRPEAQVVRLFGVLNRHMLSLDQPDHTRLRGLVQKAFTPRFVEDLRPRIESLAQELLERVAGQNQIDLIRDYALPLPVIIIAEILGIPVADRERFQRWSAALADFGGLLRMLGSARSGWAFLRYIRRLIRQRRKRPAGDLISALIAAEEAGDRLSEDELVAMVFLLLVAGYETTVNLIGNGTLALLENPAELEKLRAEAALMPTAVEELLRYDSSLKLATPRWALCDVKIADVTIPQGSVVVIGIASAHRDPREFERPDELDLEREPNRQLAFGKGIHYCLGAPLARLEAQIAFTTLLRHFADLRLAVPRTALVWRRSLPFRGLITLPISLSHSATRSAST